MMAVEKRLHEKDHGIYLAGDLINLCWMYKKTQIHIKSLQWPTDRRIE